MKNIFFSLSFILFLFSCQSGDYESNRKAKSDEHIAAITTIQSEQMHRLSILEENFRTLNGKLEELQFALDNRVNKQLNVIKSNLVGVERRLPLPSLVNKNSLIKDKIFVKENQNESAKTLESALLNIERANFKKATIVLRDIDSVIDPKIKYRGIFWNALALEALFEYNDAIKLYDTIINNFPKTRHAEESLKRLSSVFSKMGKAKLADLTYKKLESNYPKSEFIRK